MVGYTPFVFKDHRPETAVPRPETEQLGRLSAIYSDSGLLLIACTPPCDQNQPREPYMVARRPLCSKFTTIARERCGIPIGERGAGALDESSGHPFRSG